MPRGSKKGEHRGGRKPGTPNKPKGERAVIALEQAESEIRGQPILAERGDPVTGQWGYGLAKKFAPQEDEKGVTSWKNPGDELRFMRFLAFTYKCALGRAQFESPRYAAVAVANQGSEKTPDVYIQDPYKVMEDIVDRWIAADEAERAEKAIDVTPEPTICVVCGKPA